MTDRETWAEQRERLVRMVGAGRMLLDDDTAIIAALERIDALRGGGR